MVRLILVRYGRQHGRLCTSDPDLTTVMAQLERLKSENVSPQSASPAVSGLSPVVSGVSGDLCDF